MDSEAFIRWALDDARTVEERYATELLVEMGVNWWNSRHKIYKHTSLDETMELKRQRALNPAYEPRYSEEAVRKTAEELHRMTNWWSSGGMDDRPIRDFSVFRFLPNLESFSVNDCEVTDLSVLAEFPRLRVLTLSTRKCEDYRPLARCAHLRELAITFWRPYYKFCPLWPDFTGLDRLDQLESLSLEGNLLALPRGIAWPKVRRAVLRCLPLDARNLRDLPQLPACEFLTLAGAERLDGIEAFPRLRNLIVESNTRSFAPLTALEHLTCFTCNGFEPLDVAPLTTLPNLQCATFDTRFKYELNASTPRDFSPMGRAPKLRELHVVNCPPVDLEVAALNAMLPPWNDVFLAPQPRPLPPKLRIIIAPHTKHPGGRGIQPDPADNGLPDAGLRECEGRWIGRFVENTISGKIGCSDWGHVTGNGLYRTFEVTIESYGVVEKFREIIEAARASLTRLRPDYEAHIHIWLKVPKRKPSPAEQELIEKFEKEQDEADFERRHREQEALRERLHEYELKKQLGEPVKPEEFAPGEREPLPPPPWDEDEDDEDEDDAGDDGGGDLAVKQKPEPPPMWYDENEHPLADQYNLMAHLTLDEIWFFSHARDLAIYLMGRQPDEEIPEEKKEE
jgi:hypothetical protein